MIIKPSRERGCKLAKIQRGGGLFQPDTKGVGGKKKERKKRWRKRKRKSHYDAKRDDEIL